MIYVGSPANSRHEAASKTGEPLSSVAPLSVQPMGSTSKGPRLTLLVDRSNAALVWRVLVDWAKSNSAQAGGSARTKRRRSADYVPVVAQSMCQSWGRRAGQSGGAREHAAEMVLREPVRLRRADSVGRVRAEDRTRAL